MKLIFRLFFLLLLFIGCAKIPVQSVVLADALQTEGARMHNLNLVFLNRIFSSKREAVEKFINDTYAPAAIEIFVAKVNKQMPNTDFKKEFPELMQAIAPEINARRDSLVNVLELQKEKIVEKLNADYKVFDNAAFELKKLLQSASKIDKEKQALFDSAKALSNNRLDFNSIEIALDKFINSAGTVGGNIASLENVVNQILTRK